MQASLYREDRPSNDIYRDFRAFFPMDLITIVVTERSLGRQFAITEIKSKSEVLAGIKNFFGLENRPEEQWSYPPDMSSLISANTKNDFKGEGNTNRQSELTARISAVVVEVLPSGLMRIEGEKILAVNNEEQVMVISGLVRLRDVTSNNEVSSSQIAQMRIDYYGKGTVGEAQYGGWFARTMRLLWPF
jgi:flagellar L-ring protein precursor FlgH